MIGPSKINNGETTFTMYAHTNREYGSTSLQLCGKPLSIFPHCEESRRRRRRCFPHYSGAAPRTGNFVWRRGEEFESLILSI